MELKVIEYTDIQTSRYKAPLMMLVLFVAYIILAFCMAEVSLYITMPLQFLIYIAVFFFILYRPYKVVGKVILGTDTITLDLSGKVTGIPIEKLERIFLRYTNCYKSVGHFTKPDSNSMDIVMEGGNENVFNFVIEGKKEKERLKGILQQYKKRGIPVMVQSVVGATWQEF